MVKRRSYYGSRVATGHVVWIKLNAQTVYVSTGRTTRSNKHHNLKATSRQPMYSIRHLRRASAHLGTPFEPFITNLPSEVTNRMGASIVESIM